MVTEAEIQSIDFNSNSCVVRIPLFETTGSLEPFIAEAKICIQPGIYNGYKIGDLVWIDFINDRKEYPIVVGKIFKNATDEETNTGSVIISPSVKVSKQVSIPNETEITNTFSDFDSIQKIINNIKDIQEKIGTESSEDSSDDSSDDSSGDTPIIPDDVYSLTEVQTNKIWIDNKPIYRQTVKYAPSTISANTWTKICDLESKVDEIISVDSVVREYGGWGSSYESNSVSLTATSTGNFCVSVRKYNSASTPDAIYYLSPQSITLSPQVIINVYYTKK